MRETIQRRENDETFQVVLTDEKGNRFFFAYYGNYF